MNSKFIKALVLSIEAYHGYRGGDIEGTEIFIASQVQRMPDYFSFSLKLISNLIELLIFLTHAKRFHQLKFKRQTQLIKFFKSTNLPVVSVFLRFVESSFLMKYLEYEHAKKI